MATIDQLTVKFVADTADLISGADNVQKAIKNVGDETENLGQKSKSSLSSILPSWKELGVAAAAVGTTVAAGLAIAAKSYRDFEQTAVNAASVTGLSGQAYEDALGNIKAVSQELGSSTVFSASEAANAMYDLASAGFDVAHMTTAELQPILDIAAGTQTDLTFATKTVTDAISQFGLTTADSGRIADVYATAIGSSKATMDSLGTSMAYVGPVAQSLGYDVEEVSAALGVLYNAGLDSSTAGTSLRGALAALMDPAGSAADVVKNMGITFEDVNPATNSLSEILHVLADAGMTTEQAFALFGRESAPAMLALTSQVGQVDSLTTSLYNCGDAASDLATKQRDTLAGSWDELKGSIEGIGLDIGEKLAPYLRNIADYLTNLTPHIRSFIDGLSGLGNSPAFAKIKEFAEVALRNLKDQLSGSMSAIRSFVGSGGLNRLAEAAMNVFSAIIRVNDILGDIGVYRVLGDVIGNTVRSFLWVIDTISRVINWLANLYRSFNSAYQQMSSGAQGIRTTVGGAFQYIENVISSVINAVRNTINNGWTSIRNTTSTLWNAIRTVISTVWNGIRTIIASVGMAIVSAVSGAWNTVRNTINTSMNTIRNLINAAWNAIRTAITTVLNAIRSGVVSAWDGIRSSITNSMNTIRNLIVTAWNTIRTSITTAMNAINTAVSTAWSRIRSTISSGVESAVSAVTGAASRFYTAGSNWIGQLISGVSSRISSLRSMVNEALSLVGLSSGSSSSSSRSSSIVTSTGRTTTSTGAPYATQSAASIRQAASSGTLLRGAVVVNINNRATDVNTAAKTTAKVVKSAVKARVV